MKQFNKKIHLLWLLLGLLAGTAYSQTRIAGRVTDGTSGEALIGASVLEKGTNNGAVTDVDGKFVINVGNTKGTLVVNYTGYASREIPIAGKTTIDITLSEDSGILEEMVVVGYGVQRKSDHTGAVGSVKSKELERIPAASIEQALQGKMAGVYVIPASGQPGAGAVIRIRGTGTLNNASPLYVVDGMLLDDANFVNPQDVESIEVLKDASATAIYGNRGANGVIIITTKSGSVNRKAVITLSSFYGNQKVIKKLNLLNGSEFAQMYNELPGNSKPLANPERYGAGTDWQDVVLRDAPIGMAQLGANGVWHKLNYNISGNYFGQKGIVKETEYNRYSGRFNGAYPILKTLKVGTNMVYSRYQLDDVGGGVLGGAYRMPSIFSVYDSTGKYSDPTAFGQSIGNPAADLFYKNDQNTVGKRLVGTVNANWTFWKDFTFRVNYGFDRNDLLYYYHEPVFMVTSSQLNNVDHITHDTTHIRNWLLENTLTYDKKWEDTHLTLLAGQSSQEFSFFKRHTIDQILQPNGEERSEWAMLSYISRANVTFFDRYLLTASLRADGSSRFSKANRWGYFPSFAAGWNISEEPFMRGQRLVEKLKLRASWGITGNDKIQEYPSLGSITSYLYSSFGDTVQQGATLVDYANADVRWETTRQTDVGLEFALFKGKFSAEIDWYKRFTFDILSDLPIPDYVGSGSFPFVNAAQVKNTGWDFTLLWRETRNKLTYNLGLLLSPVHNEVVKLNEGKSEIFEGSVASGDFATHTTVGNPIGAFYGYKVAGVFQNQEEINSSPNFGVEKPGDFKFADINGDGKLDGGDRTYLGSPIPTLTYGFNAGLELYGFDFVLDFFGIKGNKVVNAKAIARFDTPNWEKIWYDNRWTGEGTSNTVPRATNGGHNYRMSDFLVEDGAFLRLRTIMLGYSFPKAWLNKVNMTRARIYVSGTNMWTKQAYSGYTPQFPGENSFRTGIDYLSYPDAKNVFFGLDVTF